jgi:hypothetical protein
VDWLRLWHDMPTDPKWRTISKKSGQSIPNIIAVYSMMLVCSSRSEIRGTLENWESEDVAAALDLEPKDIDDIYKAMQGKVLDGDKLTGWEKRQPDDPTGYQRVRRYRESQKESVTFCNDEKRLVTPDKIREDEIITEQIITEPEQKRSEKKPPLLDGEQELFNQALAITKEKLSLTTERRQVMRDIRHNVNAGAENFLLAVRNMMAIQSWPKKSVTYFTDKPFDAINRVDQMANSPPSSNGFNEPGALKPLSQRNK